MLMTVVPGRGWQVAVPVLVEMSACALIFRSLRLSVRVTVFPERLIVPVPCFTMLPPS